MVGAIQQVLEIRVSRPCEPCCAAGALLRRCGCAERSRRGDRDPSRDGRAVERQAVWPAPRDAASRRAMGNVTLAREDARAERIAPWLDSVWQDLRYGVRHLRAHPVFAITTGATLLVATVLNTSFFTLFNATVLRTWPVPDAGRVVIVQSRSAEPGGADGVLMSDFEVIQKQFLAVRRLVCDSRRWQSRLDDATGDRRFHLLRPVRVRERELLPWLAHPDGNRARLHA